MLWWFRSSLLILRWLSYHRILVLLIKRLKLLLRVNISERKFWNFSLIVRFWCIRLLMLLLRLLMLLLDLIVLLSLRFLALLTCMCLLSCRLLLLIRRYLALVSLVLRFGLVLVYPHLDLRIRRHVCWVKQWMGMSGLVLVLIVLLLFRLWILVMGRYLWLLNLIVSILIVVDNWELLIRTCHS